MAVDALNPGEILSLLNQVLNSVLAGYAIASILYGIVSIQSLNYFQKAKSDSKYMKFMIAFLWSLGSLQLALVIHNCRFVLVANFTNFMFVKVITWSMPAFVIVSETSKFIIRLFYMRRIWIMSDRNLLLTFIATIFNFTAFGFSMAFGVRFFSFSSFSHLHEISWLLSTAFGSTVSADLFSSLSLCYLLMKGRSGCSSTGKIIKQLVIYVIGTGLLTSLVGTATFISFLAQPLTGAYAAIYTSLPSLYFSSLLSMLNRRRDLRGELRDGVERGGRTLQVPTGNFESMDSQPNMKQPTCLGLATHQWACYSITDTGWKRRDVPSERSYNAG